MPEPKPATAAYFAATADGPFDHQRDAYEQGWEDGAAALRAKLRAEIDPDKLDLLADWFDADDALKGADPAWPSPQRGVEVQADLRRWARLLRGRP